MRAGSRDSKSTHAESSLFVGVKVPIEAPPLFGYRAAKTTTRRGGETNPGRDG